MRSWMRLRAGGGEGWRECCKKRVQKKKKKRKKERKKKPEFFSFFSPSLSREWLCRAPGPCRAAFFFFLLPASLPFFTDSHWQKRRRVWRWFVQRVVSES